jgi:hypothetical protein
MIARYGNLDLDSGARQIVRHPKKIEELNFEPMLNYKSPNIASGATPIGSAKRAPDRNEGSQYWRYRSIKTSTTQSTKLKEITPIGSEFYGWINPNIFSQKLTTTWDSRVALSQQNSNAVIYHEGKTPGSVLCGLVYAHGCALLVCIRVYDAKKILVDALGTLRTTGIHSL